MLKNNRRTSKSARCSSDTGFTLIELAVVVAIFFVIAGITVPSLPTIMTGLKLRGAAQELAGFYQQARMRAVQDNTYYVVLPASGSAGAFLDLSGDGTEAGRPTVRFPATVSLNNAGIPAGLDLVKLGFNPPDSSSLTTFDHDGTSRQGLAWNSRGLPCQRISPTSACQAGSGWVQYLQYPTGGQIAYAAVSVSPAGRARVWMYQGGIWR